MILLSQSHKNDRLIPFKELDKILKRNFYWSAWGICTQLHSSNFQFQSTQPKYIYVHKLALSWQVSTGLFANSRALTDVWQFKSKGEWHVKLFSPPPAKVMTPPFCLVSCLYFNMTRCAIRSRESLKRRVLTRFKIMTDEISTFQRFHNVDFLSMYTHLNSHVWCCWLTTLPLLKLSEIT